MGALCVKHLFCLSLSLFLMACQTPVPQLSLSAPQANGSTQPLDRQAASGQILSPSGALPAAGPLPAHQTPRQTGPSETRPAPATASDALLAPVSVAAPTLTLSVQSLDSSSYLIRVEATGHTPSEIDILADGQSIRRFSSPPFVFSWRPERAGLWQSPLARRRKPGKARPVLQNKSFQAAGRLAAIAPEVL